MIIVSNHLTKFRESVADCCRCIVKVHRKWFSTEIFCREYFKWMFSFFFSAHSDRGEKRHRQKTQIEDETENETADALRFR